MRPVANERALCPRLYHSCLYYRHSHLLLLLSSSSYASNDHPPLPDPASTKSDYQSPTRVAYKWVSPLRPHQSSADAASRLLLVMMTDYCWLLYCVHPNRHPYWTLSYLSKLRLPTPMTPYHCRCHYWAADFHLSNVKRFLGHATLRFLWDLLS